MSRVERLCLVWFALSGAIAEPTAAQEAYPCRDAVSSGIEVRGTVRSAETNEPLVRAVFIQVGTGFCFSRTDGRGSFLITNVPSGNHLVNVGSLGYRRFEPIPIAVSRDTTVVVEIRLEAENLAADCAELAPCARFLSGPHVDPEVVTPDQALLEAAGRLAIGLAGEDWDTPDWYACLDEDPAILDLLRLSFPRLAAQEDCVFRPPQDSPGRSFRHTPTGLPARGIEVSVLESDGTRARVAASYTVGPLHALGWECGYEGGPYAWIPTICIMTWVS